jgi:hypothetical protein
MIAGNHATDIEAGPANSLILEAAIEARHFPADGISVNVEQAAKQLEAPRAYLRRFKPLSGADPDGCHLRSRSGSGAPSIRPAGREE